MAKGICPGQNTLFWRFEDIYDVPCPHCHRLVEFFKTDVKRTCPHCGQRILNPKADFSCAEWCDRAKECLGPVIYDQLMEKREIERRRREHLERLLAIVDPADSEVRRLFQRLYEENQDPSQLLDFARLRSLREENPELVDRAREYYSRFMQRPSER
ncbi:MAG TPA: hypothetical protein EYP85_05040 [Armatimonadetes bacterium]|nr:hypothetical protein [Armatimonadota bacterium]